MSDHGHDRQPHPGHGQIGRALAAHQTHPEREHRHRRSGHRRHH